MAQGNQGACQRLDRKFQNFLIGCVGVLLSFQTMYTASAYLTFIIELYRSGAMCLPLDNWEHENSNRQ